MMAGNQGELDFLDRHFEIAGADDATQTDPATQSPSGTQGTSDTGTPDVPDQTQPTSQPTQQTPITRVTGDGTPQRDEHGRFIKQPDATKPDPTKPQQTAQPPTQQQPQHRQDRHGNLIDKDGNIVAYGGWQRRLHERANRAEQGLTQAQAKLDVYEKLPKQFGLTDPEVAFGIKTAYAYKSQPIETARWFVQQALARGATLPQILGDQAGQIAGSGVQTDAIKSMIQEMLAPIIGEQQNRQAQTELDNRVAREHAQFLATHEHAHVHDDVLGAMLMSDPDISPDGAYWRLRGFAQQHGLDFTQPLGPQIDARKATGASQTQVAQHPVHGQTRPMPNGAGGGNGAALRPRVDELGMESVDDIIKASMREAGFTIQ